MSTIKKNGDAEEVDKPVEFSKSKAHDHNSFDTFVPLGKEYPWYQTASITLSLTVFMVYFFILREENDWDEHLKKSLYERIPGLEEQDKKLGVKHNEVIEYVKK